jgi:DNA-binding response OmpR family regulator
MADKKILIVDYDSQSLELMAGIFKGQKVQIIKAMDGQSAYDKFKSEKPNAVILEAILPKIHGFDLTKRISQETQGRVPVVIVTGLYRGPQYRHEALTSFGAADYFEKPVDKEKLAAVVMSLIQEEGDIDEDLPDPVAIIQGLSRRIKTQVLAPEKE